MLVFGLLLRHQVQELAGNLAARFREVSEAEGPGGFKLRFREQAEAAERAIGLVNRPDTDPRSKFGLTLDQVFDDIQSGKLKIPVHNAILDNPSDFGPDYPYHIRRNGEGRDERIIELRNVLLRDSKA